MKKVEDLCDWLGKQRDYLRSEYQKLTPEEKEWFGNYDLSKTPCQVDVFWLEYPEWQLFVYTNFEDLGDQIKVNGPFKWEDFLVKSKESLESKKWDRPPKTKFPDWDTYSNILAFRIREFYKDVMGLAGAHYFGDEKWDELTYVLGAGDFESGSYEIKYGNVSNKDYKVWIDERVRYAKEELQNSKVKHRFGKDYIDDIIPTLDGWGVYFQPRIKVFERVKRKPEDILFDRKIDPFNEVAMIKLDFGEIKIYVTGEGLIMVFPKKQRLYIDGKDPRKSVVLDVINVVMSLFLINGFNTISVRTHELIQIGYSERQEKVRHSIIGGAGDLYQTERYEKGDYFTEISKKNIESIISQAIKIYNDENVRNDIIFLLEGYTNLKNSEFSQSFIMNWTIAERYVDEEWKKMIIKRGIAGERKDGLKDVRKWTTYNKLEFLNASGYLDDVNFSIIRNLNIKRNDLVHDGKPIMKEDAEKLYDFVYNLIKSKIN